MYVCPFLLLLIVSCILTDNSPVCGSIQTEGCRHHLGLKQALLKYKHSIMDVYVAFILVRLRDTVRGLSAVTSKNSTLSPPTLFRYSL